MKHFIFTLSLLILVVSAGCKKETKTTNEVITVVSQEEMQALLALEDVQLIDVRTPEEHKEGYIPNSQNIDFKSPTFEDDIEKLDKNIPVILYCKSGGRSARCAIKMKEAGFTKIYDLEGGFSKWKHNDMEIKID